MSKLTDLIDRVEELTDDKGYTDFPCDEILKIGDKAVLVQVKGQDVWFPYAQLREHGGQIFASEWIIGKKGL